jgi:ribose-phosphate pyrophosphokinase
MITVIAGNHRYPLSPTIFPDGTSQVWKLPEDVLQCSSVTIDWRFEYERELIDIMSVGRLLSGQHVVLHIPYLPYARQDKATENTSTFNLSVLAQILNSGSFNLITSYDTHNTERARELIRHFQNLSPYDFHYETITSVEPDYIVFPDAGAAHRYDEYGLYFVNTAKIVCDKTRDQLTGQITGHEITQFDTLDVTPKRFLIIDDLCDGGATFVSVAKMLRQKYSDIRVDLCVSHGLFSKGRETLLANGIDNLYTTNSLIKNEDGFNV